MQEIDRIKVQHAKNIVYNPETGNALPKFNMMYVSQINSPRII